jgi:hypothetical protein
MSIAHDVLKVVDCQQIKVIFASARDICSDAQMQHPASSLLDAFWFFFGQLYPRSFTTADTYRSNCVWNFGVPDYRVALIGTDPSGYTVQRMNPSLISPVIIKVDIDAPSGERSLTLSPGDSVTVDVKVVSNGDPNTWYIRVTDTEGFYTGQSPIMLVGCRLLSFQSIFSLSAMQNYRVITVYVEFRLCVHFFFLMRVDTSL